MAVNPTRNPEGHSPQYWRRRQKDSPLPEGQMALEPTLKKPLHQRLLRFLEEPLFTLPVGIVGGIVGVLLYTPVLAVCGACVILAFHRAKVVDGEPLKVQIPSYGVLCAVILGILFYFHVVINQKLSEANTSLSQLVASAVVKVLSRDTDTPTATSTSAPLATIPASPPPLTHPSNPHITFGPTVQGGFHEAVDEIAVEFGSGRMIVPMKDLKRQGFATIARFGNTMISLKLSKDGSTFLLNFTGWAGGFPLEVKDNEITIGNEEKELAERNYSENAFEIVDKDYRPVFQMIRTSASSMTINGIFPGGRISPRTGLPILSWVSNETGIETSSLRPANFNLRPLFKYPYWKYPHVFAEN